MASCGTQFFSLEFWEDIVSVEMFLIYSIKISSWLLLTVVSFNFDRYQFSNDLFILLFYKRWSGRIPQTTKVSIHNLPFFFQFTKIDTHKINWIHSNRIYYNKWCVIEILLKVALKHHKSKKINTIDLDIFISVWKQIYYSCTFQYVHIRIQNT
jgi:hypothetical protein